jgi:hypothetical protein
MSILPPTPCIENEIQRQINTLSSEIISSLADCEKRFLNGLPAEFVFDWLLFALLVKKESHRGDSIFINSDRIIDNISNAIDSEMTGYIIKKYDLKMQGLEETWTQEFKRYFILIATANIFIYKECSIAKAIDDLWFYDKRAAGLIIEGRRPTPISASDEKNSYIDTVVGGRVQSSIPDLFIESVGL